MPLLFHNLNILTLPSFSLFLHQFVLQKGNQVIGISMLFYGIRVVTCFYKRNVGFVSEEDNICLQFFINFTNFDKKSLCSRFVFGLYIFYKIYLVLFRSPEQTPISPNCSVASLRA